MTSSSPSSSSSYSSAPSISIVVTNVNSSSTEDAVVLSKPLVRDDKVSLSTVGDPLLRSHNFKTKDEKKTSQKGSFCTNTNNKHNHTQIKIKNKTKTKTSTRVSNPEKKREGSPATSSFTTARGSGSGSGSGSGGGATSASASASASGGGDIDIDGHESSTRRSGATHAHSAPALTLTLTLPSKFRPLVLGVQKALREAVAGTRTRDDSGHPAASSARRRKAIMEGENEHHPSVVVVRTTSLDAETSSDTNTNHRRRRHPPWKREWSRDVLSRGWFLRHLLEDDEWRKEWRGIHLPPTSSRVPRMSGDEVVMAVDDVHGDDDHDEDKEDDNDHDDALGRNASLSQNEEHCRDNHRSTCLSPDEDGCRNITNSGNVHYTAENETHDVHAREAVHPSAISSLPTTTTTPTTSSPVFPFLLLALAFLALTLTHRALTKTLTYRKRTKIRRTIEGMMRWTNQRQGPFALSQEELTRHLEHFRRRNEEKRRRKKKVKCNERQEWEQKGEGDDDGADGGKNHDRDDSNRNGHGHGHGHGNGVAEEGNHSNGNSNEQSSTNSGLGSTNANPNGPSHSHTTNKTCNIHSPTNVHDHHSPPTTLLSSLLQTITHSLPAIQTTPPSPILKEHAILQTDMECLRAEHQVLLSEKRLFLKWMADKDDELQHTLDINHSLRKKLERWSDQCIVIDELMDQLSQTKKEKEELIAALEAHRHSHRERMDEWQSTVKSYEETMERLTGENAGLTKRVTELEQENREIKKEIMAEFWEGAGSEHPSLEGMEVAGSAGLLISEHGSLTEDDHDLSDSSSSSSGSSSTSSVSSEIKRKDEENELLRAENQMLQQSIEDLRRSLALTKEALDMLTQEKNEYDLSDLQAENDALQTSNAALREELEAARHKNERSFASASTQCDIDGTYETLEATNVDLQHSIEVAKQSLEDHDRTVAEVTVTLNKAFAHSTQLVTDMHHQVARLQEKNQKNDVRIPPSSSIETTSGGKEVEGLEKQASDILHQLQVIETLKSHLVEAIDKNGEKEASDESKSHNETMTRLETEETVVDDESDWEGGDVSDLSVQNPIAGRTGTGESRSVNETMETPTNQNVSKTDKMNSDRSKLTSRRERHLTSPTSLSAKSAASAKSEKSKRGGFLRRWSPDGKKFIRLSPRK